MDVPKLFVSWIQGITMWEMSIPIPLPEHFRIMHKQGIFFNLGTKDNSLCKNITLINDNDNNNCICCFGNDLLIFLYFCLFVCLCTFWILLFKINESFDRIKSQHNIQKHRKPFSPQVPSNPWLTDISSLLIFYHECKNRINPSKIFSGSHAIS